MCYFNNIVQYPVATIDTICHTLQDQKFGHVDAIVGTGVSGILALVPVSIKSGVPFLVIRKKNDSSHTSSRIEPYISTDIRRYVIIDDLIDSGNTINQIIKVMTSRFAQSECVGIVLYQARDDIDDHHRWDVKSGQYSHFPVRAGCEDTTLKNDIPILRLYDDILAWN